MRSRSLVAALPGLALCNAAMMHACPCIDCILVITTRSGMVLYAGSPVPLSPAGHRCCLKRRRWARRWAAPWLGLHHAQPWRTGSPKADTRGRALHAQVLEPVIAGFAPDLILVSAGYDAVQGDPLGGMSLTPEVFGHLTQRLIRLARAGRLVLALEGGYNLRQTAECAAECAKVGPWGWQEGMMMPRLAVSAGIVSFRV